MYIFDIGGGINTTRLNHLETAVEALSSSPLKVISELLELKRR